MQGAVRQLTGRSATALALFALLVLAVLAAGCSTSVQVAFDEQQDFSRYRTWSWSAHGSSVVGAPPGEERSLDALTEKLVEHELAGRGLVHAAESADLLVAYTLRVRRRLVSVSETGAEDLLASHHASPSFVVQATESRIDVYYDGLLLIAIRDRQSGEVVWKGELRATHKDTFDRDLPESVAQMMAEFPIARSSE